LVFQN